MGCGKITVCIMADILDFGNIQIPVLQSSSESHGDPVGALNDADSCFRNPGWIIKRFCHTVIIHIRLLGIPVFLCDVSDIESILVFLKQIAFAVIQHNGCLRIMICMTKESATETVVEPIGVDTIPDPVVFCFHLNLRIAGKSLQLCRIDNIGCNLAVFFFQITIHGLGCAPCDDSSKKKPYCKERASQP